MPSRAILNGESFYAWDLTEQDRERGFICPQCEEIFIIVLPSLNIIKHFRHKSKAAHDWKPESQAHLAMKKSLMELADSYEYPCEVEVKISHDGAYRIADVLIKEKIVVECQCSKISIKEYEERTRFYQDNDYQIIWLLGSRETSGLDHRIGLDYFDVFYYEEGSICNQVGDRISLKELIHLTSGPVLKEKREEQKRIEKEEEKQWRIKREEWDKNLEELRNQQPTELERWRASRRGRTRWSPIPERRFKQKPRGRPRKTYHLAHYLWREWPDEEKERLEFWRKNWGTNGLFIHPIIPPIIISSKNETNP